MKLPRAQEIDFDLDRYINRYLPQSQLHRLPWPISRFLGYRRVPQPEVGNLLVCAWAFVGAFSGLILVMGVFKSSETIQAHHPPLVVASLVCFLLLVSSASADVLGRNGHPGLPNDPVPAGSTAQFHSRTCTWSGSRGWSHQAIHAAVRL